jgi:hypothetical protein
MADASNAKRARPDDVGDLLLAAEAGVPEDRNTRLAERATSADLSVEGRSRVYEMLSKNNVVDITDAIDACVRRRFKLERGVDILREYNGHPGIAAALLEEADEMKHGPNAATIYALVKDQAAFLILGDLSPPQDGNCGEFTAGHLVGRISTMIDFPGGNTGKVLHHYAAKAPDASGWVVLDLPAVAGESEDVVPLEPSQWASIGFHGHIDDEEYAEEDEDDADNPTARYVADGGLADWLAANAIRVDVVVGCNGAVLYKSDRVSNLAGSMYIAAKGAPQV